MSHGDADFLGSLYALDTWLEVLDRQKPDGKWNLLLNTEDGNLFVIDFGKALAPCLQQTLVLGPDEVVPPACYSPNVRAKASKAAAVATCDIIERIEEQELTEIAASVPAAWIESAKRGELAAFLRTRQPQVRGICDQMD